MRKPRRWIRRAKKRVGEYLLDLGGGLVRVRTSDEDGQLQRFVDLGFRDPREFETYREEYETEVRDRLRARAETALDGTPDGSVDPGAFDDHRCALLYALVRSREPQTVVETGVCNGMSSAAILSSLDENRTGILHSVDLPYHSDQSLEDFRRRTFEGYGGAAIPAGREPGWLVPDRLRDRWELHIGKSQRVLPRVLEETGEIDLFVHDSEHSVPCMMFEFELAWERLRGGGFLASDDVDWNLAFRSFVEERATHYGRVGTSFGYARKQSEVGES